MNGYGGSRSSLTNKYSSSQDSTEIDQDFTPWQPPLLSQLPPRWSGDKEQWGDQRAGQGEEDWTSPWKQNAGQSLGKRGGDMLQGPPAKIPRPPDPSKPLFCNLCNVILNGPDQADTHYAGKSHKARKQLIIEQLILEDGEIKSSAGNGEKYYCIMCDMTFDAENQYQLHINSRTHRDTVLADGPRDVGSPMFGGEMFNTGSCGFMNRPPRGLPHQRRPGFRGGLLGRGGNRGVGPGGPGLGGLGRPDGLFRGRGGPPTRGGGMMRGRGGPAGRGPGLRGGPALRARGGPALRARGGPAARGVGARVPELMMSKKKKKEPGGQMIRCEVCDVTLTSISQKAMHDNGMKHQMKLQGKVYVKNKKAPVDPATFVTGESQPAVQNTGADNAPLVNNLDN